MVAGRRARRTAWLLPYLALFLSCTRMPTAPPVAITVEGRITGPDGSSIAEASVDFYPRDEILTPGYADFATTDSMGQYRASIFSGTYEVRIHPGIEGFLEHAERVTFSRRSTRYDHRFDGHLVRGSVRDPEGNMVDSGHVSARLESDMYQTAGTRFDGGAYSLLLPSGTYTFRAGSSERLSGLSFTDAGPFSIRSDTTIHIALTGVLVEGIVLDPDGAPMSDVVVDAYSRTNYASGETGADGRYRLWIHPDTYRFEFIPHDASHIAPKLVGPLEVTGPLTLDQSLAGFEWAGTVRWRSTGDPVGDALLTLSTEVSYRGAWVRTDPQGAFRFVVQPEMTYSLRAYHPDAVSTQLDGLVARTDTTFSILLDPDPTPQP